MQSNSTSKTEVKKRIERYLEALKAVSQQDPDSFAEIAPELIQRSTLNWRGSDPFFAKSLNEWLNLDMMWTPFTDIIPKDAHITKRIEDDAFDIRCTVEPQKIFWKHSMSDFQWITINGMQPFETNS